MQRNKMRYTKPQQSPALRMEAWSINCIMVVVLTSAANRNLLTVADSLTAEQYYVLLYYRIILLILYACRNAQRTTKILDPENGETTTMYDDAGRKISVSDPNSGTTVYTYDAFGNIKTQKTANNVTTTFTYDKLNRPTLVSHTSDDKVDPAVTGATPDGSTILTYDEGGKDKFANGRLTKVVDAGGTLELGYDIRGNRVYQKRDIDDLKVIFRRTFDIQNRLESTTYPDGTKVYQKYAPTGHFSGITMDTFDGSSFGHTVGSYAGPVVETTSDDKKIFKIIRETGNRVKQEIEYDPIKRRPTGLFTKLDGVHVVNQIAYSYDERNNMIKIQDQLDNSRTQEFKYDAQNRLTEAKGKYGVETYTYGDNGNLLRRGRIPFDSAQGTDSLSLTYTYGNANHKHAVTSVTSPNTGTIDYSYDESGNMETRATDTMTYNGQGKLKQIVTGGGDTFEYLYDSTGNRIRKKAKNSGVITYNFDGLYEITKTGSEGVPHTLYFKGLYGDVFAQMTRGDAVLRREDDFSSSKSSDFFDVASSSGLLSFAKGDDFPPGSNVKDFFCGEVAGSCSEYYLNAVKFYWVKGIVKGYTVVSRVEFRVGLWIMLIVMVYLLSQILSKLSLPSRTGINDDILEKTLFPLRLCASVATISILFTFTQL
ncbi:MAG: RHS repeat protein [Leptospiraceae bacterium]|nr:RHS repeat protein [Leptospiraceae bacterium]